MHRRMKRLSLIITLLIAPLAVVALTQSADAPQHPLFNLEGFDNRLATLRRAHADMLNAPDDFKAVSARAVALKALGLNGLSTRDVTRAGQLLIAEVGKQDHPSNPDAVHAIETSLKTADLVYEAVREKRDLVCADTDRACQHDHVNGHWMAGDLDVLIQYIQDATLKEMRKEAGVTRRQAWLAKRKMIAAATQIKDTLADLDIAPLD